MPIDINQFVELSTGIIIIVSLLVYLIFSLIVIRQVQLLNKTLLTGLSPTLKLFSYLHALFAGTLLVSAVLRF